MKPVVIAIFAILTIIAAIVSQLTQWVSVDTGTVSLPGGIEFSFVGTSGLWKACGANGQCINLPQLFETSEVQWSRILMILGTVVFAVIAVLLYVKVPKWLLVLLAWVAALHFVAPPVIWLVNDEGEVEWIVGFWMAIVAAVLSITTAIMISTK